MKVSIYEWAGQSILEKHGYVNNQEIDPDNMMNVVQHLFGVGLNVMLYHTSPDHITIFADTKRFTQR